PVNAGDDHGVSSLSAITSHESQLFVIGREGDGAVNVFQNSARNATEHRYLIQHQNRVVLFHDDVIDVSAVAREGQSPISDFGRRDDLDVIRFSDLSDEQALFAGVV